MSMNTIGPDGGMSGDPMNPRDTDVADIAKTDEESMEEMPKDLPTELSIDTNTEQFQVLLSNSIGFMLLTTKFHYDVTGMNFDSLHKRYENVIEYMGEFIDDVAERIRQLGGHPNISLEAFASTNMIDTPEDNLSAMVQVNFYYKNFVQFIEGIRRICINLKDSNDFATLSWLGEELEWFEKQLWQFRAILEGC